MRLSEARNFLINRFKKLAKYKDRLARTDNSDSIHKYRTNVKKIRAILRLLSFEVKNPDDLKFPKQFKEIYKQCGKIRELQLQLIQFGNSGAYSRLLLRGVSKGQRQLNRLYKRKIIYKTQKRMFRELPGRLHSNTVIHFMRDKFDEIQKWRVLPDLSDKDVHSIRKNIKDISYTEDVDKEKKISTSSVRQLEKTASDVGKYNDMRSLLKYLSPQWLNELPRSQKRVLIITRDWHIKNKIIMRTKVLKNIKSMQIPSLTN